MAEKYYSILTNRGKELEAQSSATGKPVIIKDFVVGDGNGQAVKPDPAQTKLAREVYRNAISALQVSPDQANQFIAQLILPVNVGGFVVREVGLLTDAGELYSVANSAAIEKPENGVSVNLQYRLAVSESANIELKVATGDGLFLRIDKNLAEIAAKGEAAQKSSREAIGVLDATTGRKGLVQLSSATDNSSEALAATSKAVKAAYDLANSKYTAQDASTAKKGIVQLSNATDSTSETLAATPKAVKAVNDELNTVKNNLGTAASKDVQTSKDDVTAGRVLVNGSAVAIRSVRAQSGATGINVADANNLPSNSVSFVYSTAANSPEITGSLLDFSGLNGSYNVQIAASYGGNGNIIKFRTYNGDAAKKWNPWYTIYHSGNKPTAGDVGAIPLTGSTSVTGIVRSSAELQSTSANSFRIGFGGYGTFWRNDGSNLYLMLTNKDDPWGSYNALRPFRVSLEAGEVLISKLNLSDFGYFDARYYTKSQSDAGYAAKTNVYTKGESDSRYNLKNTATKSANALTHKDASTGVMEVVMSNISVTNNTNVNVTFPTAFPNACVGVVITYDGAGHGSGDDSSIVVPSYSRTGCVLRANNAHGKFMLIAKGY